MNPMSRDEVNQRLSEAIAADPGLRDRLISDPRTVLASIVGIEIPDFVNVTVHEESLSDIHLVLGSQAPVLGEEDLQLVSGGWNSPNGRTSHCGTNCGT